VQKYKTPGIYNTGENIDELGFGDDFSERMPKAQSIKERIDKLFLIS
jgi:hypothetical protein